MESTGYKIVSTSSALKPELIESVKEAIGPDQLSGQLSGGYANPSKHWEGGRSDALFDQCAEHGLDVDALINGGLRKGYQQVIHQPVRVVRFLPNTLMMGPMRAHPSPNSISIFRPLYDSVGPENGMFKIYPCSQSLTKAEIEGRSSEVRLDPHQALVTLGPLWVEPVHSGGGVIIWKGCSESPVGMDTFGDHVLPFMKQHEQD
ncbi:uncharacterized protein KD926_002452 [Aspergillus affinis]|uniref:uncharacterized protein n=1 Tax=Aspergillus affinis TaxID=1070780 RepID=UPI0022FF1BF3|nr:uncharacterized protein KD926_002452 [Aspergillus affinis]KAI9036075.1 hypothetical protein KD926_002452 [Aspergillus affinis]